MAADDPHVGTGRLKRGGQQRHDGLVRRAGVSRGGDRDFDPVRIFTDDSLPGRARHYLYREGQGAIFGNQVHWFDFR